jgi:hypothetical protein
MPIIAGHTKVDPDDRDEAVAVMRDLLTRACDASGCLDAAITADSVDPTGAALTGRRTAEQVDHWNADDHGVPTSRIELGVVRVIDTPEATHLRSRIRRRTDERTT